MFSVNTALNLVFADEQDIYYSDSPIRFGLDEYLWLNLKEVFSRVCFLDKDENGYFYRTFGKNNSGSTTTNWLFRQAAKKRMRSDECRDSVLNYIRESSAVICSIEQFCEIFNTGLFRGIGIERKKEELFRQRRGVIVIKISPVVESNRSYFLTAKAFAHFGDQVILNLRADHIENMYKYIKDGKNEACVFLSIPTRENIKALVMDVLMQCENRDMSTDLIDNVVGYLLYFFSNELMAEKECPFEINKPMECCLLKDIYDELLKDEVWNKVVKRAELASTEPIGNRYREIFLLRKNEDILGRLLLCGSRGKTGQEIGDDTEATVRDKYREIRKSLLCPSNSEDDPKVRERLIELEKYHHNCNQHDKTSLHFILEAMLYAINNIGVDRGDRKAVEDNLKKYDTLINLSKEYYEAKTLISTSRSVRGGVEVSGAFAQKIEVINEMRIREYETKAEQLRKMISEIQQTINTHLLDVTMSEILKDVNRFSETALKQIPENTPKGEVSRYLASEKPIEESRESSMKKTDLDDAGNCDVKMTEEFLNSISARPPVV